MTQAETDLVAKLRTALLDIGDLLPVIATSSYSKIEETVMRAEEIARAALAIALPAETETVRVNDLAMLVRRLVRRLGQLDQASEVMCSQAMEYLHRHDLNGSILREGAVPLPKERFDAMMAGMTVEQRQGFATRLNEYAPDQVSRSGNMVSSPMSHSSSLTPTERQAADALAAWIKLQDTCECFAETTCEGCQLLTAYYAARAQAGKESA